VPEATRSQKQVRELTEMQPSVEHGGSEPEVESEPLVETLQHHILAESTAAILTARNPEKLWQVATHAIQQLLRTKGSAIYLYDVETEALSCQAATGLSDADKAKLCELLPKEMWSDPRPARIGRVASDLKAGPLRDLLLSK
jgi:GAF domain-containing protein